MTRPTAIDQTQTKKAQKKQELIPNISKGKSIAKIQIPQGTQAKKAADMLDAWFAAKGRNQATEKDAHQILSNLGFNLKSLTFKKSGQYTWIDVNSEPISDQNRCPVSAYGSAANGHYRILCVWGIPNEQDILNSVGETALGEPVFVFHFGRMTVKRRRDLADLPSELEVRKKIAAVTGNWSNLLQEFYQFAQANPHCWQDSLAQLKNQFNKSDKLINSMGFDGCEPQRKLVMRTLAQWGEAAAVEELIEFLDDVSPEVVKQTLRWADLLSLVSHLGNQKQDGKDYWQIDPVVGRLLESMAE